MSTTAAGRVGKRRPVQLEQLLPACLQLKERGEVRATQTKRGWPEGGPLRRNCRNQAGLRQGVSHRPPPLDSWAGEVGCDRTSEPTRQREILVRDKRDPVVLGCSVRLLPFH